MNKTRANRTCLVWTNTDSSIANAEGNEDNYCRNPDHSREPWCYLRTDIQTVPTGENRTWQYCEVPMCSK